MNQPDILISHGNAPNGSCLDGFAAAWAISGKWPNTPTYFAQYGDTPPDVTGLGVLITDFSYPEAVLREMAAKARWIHVLDHHETARPILLKLREEGVIKAEFDLERSGAALAWDYAWGAGRARPWLIQYVQDRDLWKYELNGTREVNAMLASHPLDFKLWTTLADRLERPHTRADLINEGAGILRGRDRDLRDILASTRRMMFIGEHEVPVANVPYIMASDAGNILAEGHPFAAVYFDRADGVRQVSLRSTQDGLNVAEIAQQYGGGGHAHAAGFSIPFDGNHDLIPYAAEDDEDEAK